MFVNKSLVKFRFHVINKNLYRFRYKWIQPEGYDTGIKIYNPFVKNKVPLIFPNKFVVKWYICGPTVYDVAHIGHASCYIRFDIIRRILEEYFDIKPLIALGVTDIAESITLQSKKLKVSINELVAMYESEFFSHMKALNVLPPLFKLKVSQHISEIENFINVLKKKGLAYNRKEDILFKISQDKNYGRFEAPKTSQSINDLEFALWRSVLDIPGWHVECSAMASSIFGSSVDIHSGGADLIFPHHENEESLCTCYHGCDQWVNYWIHSGLVSIGEEKMSKSLGNLISITDFLDGNTGDNLRMLCLMNSYRSNLVYNENSISSSKKLCDRIMKFLQISDRYVHGIWLDGNINEPQLLKLMEETKSKIKECLKNDFGTREALREVLNLIKRSSTMLGQNSETTARSVTTMASVNHFVREFFNSFGFEFAKHETASTTMLESIIDTAVNFRSSIRSKVLNFDKSISAYPLKICDDFRLHFEKLGIILYDLNDRTHWTLIANKNHTKLLLSNLLDGLANFFYLIFKFSQNHKQQLKGLENECRSLQLYLTTLGIVFRVEESVLEWSFSEPDPSNMTRLYKVISETSKFYNRVKEVADLMEEEEDKEAKLKLLDACESALLNLKSCGLTVNEKDNVWVLNENKVTGESILQNIIDILIHAIDTIKLITYTANAIAVADLIDINKETRSLLKSYGFLIYKQNLLLLTSWRVVKNTNPKELLMVLIEETLSYIYKLKNSMKNERDLVLKRVVIQVHDTVIKDLEEIGVVVLKGKNQYSWKFKTLRHESK